MTLRTALLPAFLVVLFSLSCSRKEEVQPRPEQVLGKEELIAVLTDLQLVESILPFYQRDPGFEVKRITYFKAVFDKHHITREQLDKSLAYYQKDLKEYDDILAGVIERLSKMQGKEIKE
jgi:ParB-like chromosome segregation protein Spo0J